MGTLGVLICHSLPYSFVTCSLPETKLVACHSCNSPVFVLQMCIAMSSILCVVRDSNSGNTVLQQVPLPTGPFTQHQVCILVESFESHIF